MTVATTATESALSVRRMPLVVGRVGWPNFPEVEARMRLILIPRSNGLVLGCLERTEAN